MGREHLRLDSADGEDPSAEGRLARHRRIATDAPAGEERDECGEDGDARRRAVLGYRAGGHVDVHVLVLCPLGWDAEAFGVAADVGERRASGLLHDVAELSGDLDVAPAGHPRRLDEEDRAAEGRPREAGRDAGDRRALGHFAVELGPTEVRGDIALVDCHRAVVLATRDLEGRGTAKLLDLAIELPDAGFPGVVTYDRLERVVRDRELVLCDAVLLRPLRDEVLASDADLLVCGVAAELDDLEAVAERCRERLEDVRHANEHDLGEIERQLEVVVGERLVLLGIEHLEQRRFGRAAPARAHLVDLVEQDDRVLHLRLAQRVQDTPGEGADVRAPVAADFGLVAHAAERDTDEGPTGGVGDRLTERRLADAGRSDEAKQRALRVAGELQHGDVLEDALLDVLEAVVVAFELRGDLVEVDLGAGAPVPREIGDQLEVVADHVHLGAALAHALEPAQLTVDDLTRVLREVGCVESLLERLDVVVAAFVAELTLDRAHVLAKDGLALVLAQLLLDLAFDLGADLGLRLALADALHEEADARRGVRLAEELDLVVGGEIEERCDAVGERAGVTGVERVDLRERASGFTCELGDLARQGPGELLRFERVAAGLRDRRDLGLVERVFGRESVEACASEALERQLVFAFALPRDRLHPRVRAEGVDVVAIEIDRPRVLLGEGDDDVTGIQRTNERDRSGAPDGERERRPGKEHPGAERQGSDGGGRGRYAVAEVGHLDWSPGFFGRELCARSGRRRYRRHRCEQ